MTMTLKPDNMNISDMDEDELRSQLRVTQLQQELVKTLKEVAAGVVTPMETLQALLGVAEMIAEAAQAKADQAEEN